VKPKNNQIVTKKYTSIPVRMKKYDKIEAITEDPRYMFVITENPTKILERTKIHRNILIMAGNRGKLSTTTRNCMIILMVTDK